MPNPTDYVLGQSERAARRLYVQDQHLAAASEGLLDELALRPTDRVVELGCGPGGFTKRILHRLGEGGVVVGVDSGPGLLEQAKTYLADAGLARFEPVLADVAKPGPWLDGADVLVGRAVLHHVPMAEFLVGRLRASLRPGTRVGFVEPDFRSPFGHLAYLAATGRAELTPLLEFARMINELYLARRISPAVGATLGRTMEMAGYRQVRSTFAVYPTDELVLENIVMLYDEVREVLGALGIMSGAEVEEQLRLLEALPRTGLPPVWGVYRVSAVV